MQCCRNSVCFTVVFLWPFRVWNVEKTDRTWSQSVLYQLNHWVAARIHLSQVFAQTEIISLYYIYLADSLIQNDLQVHSSMWMQPKNCKNHASSSNSSNILYCFKYIYKQWERGFVSLYWFCLELQHVCSHLWSSCETVWTQKCEEKTDCVGTRVSVCWEGNFLAFCVSL